MDMSRLALPLIAFAGGAVLGRLIGPKVLARGAETMATIIGMQPAPKLAGLVRAAAGNVPTQRRGVSRPARRRVSQKRPRRV